jgi:hypothetical protein
MSCHFGMGRQQQKQKQKMHAWCLSVAGYGVGLGLGLLLGLLGTSRAIDRASVAGGFTTCLDITAAHAAQVFIP